MGMTALGLATRTAWVPIPWPRPAAPLGALL